MLYIIKVGCASGCHFFLFKTSSNKFSAHKSVNQKTQLILISEVNLEQLDPIIFFVLFIEIDVSLCTPTTTYLRVIVSKHKKMTL